MAQLNLKKSLAYAARPDLSLPSSVSCGYDKAAIRLPSKLTETLAFKFWIHCAVLPKLFQTELTRFRSVSFPREGFDRSYDAGT